MERKGQSLTPTCIYAWTNFGKCQYWQGGKKQTKRRNPEVTSTANQRGDKLNVFNVINIPINKITLLKYSFGKN